MTTCRRIHIELEEYLYWREYFAAKALEGDKLRALFDTSGNPTKIVTLKKWIKYIPTRSEFEVGRKKRYLATALSMAAGASNKDAVELLLDHAAPKKFVNEHGGNTLMHALEFGHIDGTKQSIEVECGIS